MRRYKEGHWEESARGCFRRTWRRLQSGFQIDLAGWHCQFPSNVHSSYIAAVCDELRETKPGNAPDDEKAGWAPASVALIEQVLGRFAGFSGRDYGSSFCWLLHDRAGSNGRMRLFDSYCSTPVKILTRRSISPLLETKAAISTRRRLLSKTLRTNP